jgi:hypothetical protein
LPHHNFFQFSSCNESSYFSFIMNMPQLSKPCQNTLVVSNQEPWFRWQFTVCNTWCLQLFLVNVFQIIFIQFMDIFYFCLIYRIWELFVESFYFYTDLLKILFIYSCFGADFLFAFSFISLSYITIIIFRIICCYFFIRFK